MKSVLFVLSMILCSLLSSFAMAQEFPPESQRVECAIEKVMLARLDKKVFAWTSEMPTNHSLRLPRFYGSLVSVHWDGETRTPKMTVVPEPNEWVIRWEGDATANPMLVLEFDAPPLIESELQAIAQRGDGTLALHAHQAITQGEKIRFEPQPHKNTVGYWVVPTDEVYWNVAIEQPGKLNVGILQGCGAGQGGSDAILSIERDGSEIATLEFNVLETGHFQNFVWRNLGVVSLDKPGEYRLKIKAKRIQKSALMDVRMVHLSPAR